jgi:hypothetical protein
VVNNIQSANSLLAAVTMLRNMGDYETGYAMLEVALDLCSCLDNGQESLKSKQSVLEKLGLCLHLDSQRPKQCLLKTALELCCHLDNSPESQKSKQCVMEIIASDVMNVI